MKVLIVRNAMVEKNASMVRIIDALSENKDVSILTRNSSKENGKVIINKKFYYKNKSIKNYVINLNRFYSKGVGNLINLLLLQMIIFYFLVKNRREFDVIHSFDLDCGVPVMVFSMLFRRKYVYHIADFYIDSRGGIPSKIKKYIRKLEFKVINKAEACIICTEERRKQIDGAYPKKLYVIHNTPIFEELSKNNIYTESNKKQIHICYIGSLSKNRFINEILEVAVNNKNIYLTIGGLGELEKEVKSKYSDIENINYLGEVEYLDTFSYYSECNLMVAIYNPEVRNHRYSAPNKVYEAMFLGKPIIVASNTGIDTLVKKNNIGYTIDYSKEDFSSLIDYIMKNKEDLKIKGINAKTTYDSYSWSEMKIKVNEIYKTL